MKKRKFVINILIETAKKMNDV